MISNAMRTYQLLNFLIVITFSAEPIIQIQSKDIYIFCYLQKWQQIYNNHNNNNNDHDDNLIIQRMLANRYGMAHVQNVMRSTANMNRKDHMKHRHNNEWLCCCLFLSDFKAAQTKKKNE